MPKQFKHETQTYELPEMIGANLNGKYFHR